jgi:hypothetical protein
LREARAAARLRHPNVASVFHLGRTLEKSVAELAEQLSEVIAKEESPTLPGLI